MGYILDKLTKVKDSFISEKRKEKQKEKWDKAVVKKIELLKEKVNEFLFNTENNLDTKKGKKKAERKANKIEDKINKIVKKDAQKNKKYGSTLYNNNQISLRELKQSIETFRESIGVKPRSTNNPEHNQVKVIMVKDLLKQSKKPNLSSAKPNQMDLTQFSIPSNSNSLPKRKPNTKPNTKPKPKPKPKPSL